MSMSNCTSLVQEYKWHWNRKLLSLLGLVPLKILGIQALVPLALVLGLGVWLELSILVSQLSMLANCSLVLSLLWGLDHEQVKDIGLLAVKLVIGLVTGVSFQLGLLSVGMILGPGTGEAGQLGWIVLEEDFRDEQPLWWICLECCGAFGR